MNRQVTRPYTYTKVNFIGIHITTDINETSRNGNIGAIFFFNFSSDLLSFFILQGRACASCLMGQAIVMQLNQGIANRQLRMCVLKFCQTDLVVILSKDKISFRFCPLANRYFLQLAHLG